MEETNNRSHIEEQHTWDLTSIYTSDKEWENDLEQLSEDIEAAKVLAGSLSLSAKDLLKTTETYLELSRRLERLYVYASMKNDQDTTVALYQEYQSKAVALFATFSQVFAFYEPELLALNQEDVKDFIDQEPKLSLYTHFFEKIFKRQEHVLSQQEEALLSGAQEIFGASSDAFGILDNADITFPIVLDDEGQSVELTHGNYISLMESKKREVRQSAYAGLYNTYKQFQHTYAKTLETTVKVHNYDARVHKFSSARQSALADNFIPESVYDTLVDTVNKHLPLLHRYIQLRKKLLGLDDLKMYDVYTPLSEKEDMITFTYDHALEKAEQVLSIFGQDYKDHVHKAFTERWIDVHPNKGKRSGAYSGGAYDTKAFMLLNWQDTLDNLFTLVHETGHSMHSTYTRLNQPYVYGDYSIFLAEIASTTNENILTETLLQEVTDDKQRFAILNHYLDGFRGTIFRQTQFAEFEQAIHLADQEGQVLTSDYLNQLYAQLNEKYYGLKAEDNPEIQYEWARIPHFYYNFYVYQYATGFAAASYLADKIVHGKPEDKEAYLNFLKSGNSYYSLDIIKKAGVDMTSSEYLEQAFDVFEKRLTELENLVEKGINQKD